MLKNVRQTIAQIKQPFVIQNIKTKKTAIRRNERLLLTYEKHLKFYTIEVSIA